jgi:hypothetical protein
VPALDRLAAGRVTLLARLLLAAVCAPAQARTPRRRRVVLGGLLAVAWLVQVAPAAQADQASCGQVITTSTTITNSLAGVPVTAW